MASAPRMQTKLSERAPDSLTILPQYVPIEKLPPRLADEPVQQASVSWPQRLIVACYRVAGMALLAVILAGLASYMGLVVFYAIDSSWITPQIISPTDEHVLLLNNQLTQAEWLREKVMSDKLELQLKLRNAELQTSQARHYQEDFKKSARQSSSDLGKKLDEQNAVVAKFDSATPEILNAHKQFLSQAQGETENLHRAHLISEEEYANRNQSYNQSKAAALSLEREYSELRQASTVLSREVQSYHQLSGPQNTSAQPLTYEVLQAKTQYDSAALEMQKIADIRQAVQEESAAADREIKRQDSLLDAIHQSPYLRAMESRLTVAFMPYGNANNVHAGSPIYACSFGIIICRRAGEVQNVLPGEVQGKQPFLGKDLRGSLIEVHVDEPSSLGKQVLFLGRRPLFF